MRRSCTTTLVMALLLALGCGSKPATSPKPHEPTSAERVRMADSLSRAGRLHDALATLEEAIDRDPGNAKLHSVYGQYAFIAGRYEAAKRALDRALELDPYLTDAHNWLGVTLAELGRPEEAERHYRAALADPAYPSPEKVWLNLGLLYGSQGRDAEAIEALRRAVEIDPRFYKAHYELANALERTGELAEAAREYEVAEPDFRSEGEYFYRLGFVYFRLGESDKAVESLRRCIAVSPGSPSAARADELLEVIR